jgi:arylsulfatase A
MNKTNVMDLKPVKLKTILLAPFFTVFATSASEPDTRTNVIIILADDLGYGDLSCYGNTKVTTPAIDRLANEGIRFTDAHTTSGLCTPSRYSLLTGRYCWRTFLKKNVIANGPAMIEPDRTTVASLFKESGYNTAIFGKWHLGHTNRSEVDYNRQPLTPCANDAGFMYSFTLPVGHFYPPYVYLENGSILNYNSGDPIRLEGNKQIGGESYSYDPHNITPELVRRSVKFIEENKQNPFFLFLSLPNVHDPLTPGPQFSGHPVGAYGDYIREMDWAVNQVVDKLNHSGLDKNTLILFTSDNGASEPNSRLVKEFYNPNSPLRGDKGDLYEGGHRLPFILRWPGQAPAGMISDEFIIFSDLLRTFAGLLKHPLCAEEGPDGNNVLKAFRGKRNLYPDRSMVIHSRQGMFGLRKGDWMYLHGPGNGDIVQKYANPSERIAEVQLYNLKKDLRQTCNLSAKYPERTEKMRKILEEIVGIEAK